MWMFRNEINLNLQSQIIVTTIPRHFYDCCCFCITRLIDVQCD